MNILKNFFSWLLRNIWKIVLNLLISVMKFITLIVIALIVTNNLRFFGNMGQYLLDALKYALRLVGVGEGYLMVLGPFAFLLSIFAIYAGVEFALRQIRKS